MPHTRHLNAKNEISVCGDIQLSRSSKISLLVNVPKPRVEPTMLCKDGMRTQLDTVSWWVKLQNSETQIIIDNDIESGLCCQLMIQPTSK